MNLLEATRDVQQFLFQYPVERLTADEARLLAEKLHVVLRGHNYQYYVKDRIVIADGEYDRLYKALEQLEARFPDLITPDSPTQRVGAPKPSFSRTAFPTRASIRPTSQRSAPWRHR